jgi:N-acetylglucosamine-6-phosphate deacetylase
MDNAICLHNTTLLTGFSTMRNCAVYIKNKKIANIYNNHRFTQKKFAKNVKLIKCDDCYVLPGFIDEHIHGIGGYSTDDGETKSILKMSEILPSYGVTSFIPTINTAPEKILIKRIKAIVSAMGKEKGARILGIHLEGPFLSAEKIGGQEKEGISGVDLNYLKRLINAGKGKILNMTVAPEIKHMRELALKCLEEGIILQAGHTNATYEQMIEGMQAGIFHSTHMFNAMRSLHHREPGTVGAILTHPEISCEIIGDGIHVHPDLVKLLAQYKQSNQIVLITDSLKYTKERIPEDIDLYCEQCFKRKSDNTIMGSCITMLEGFKNLIKFGIPIEKAVQMATINPARIMRQQNIGSIIPNYNADLIVLDKNFNLKMTIINGKIIKK